ncbi:MAG TPA: hypothetical protein VI894_01965 [Candidatus Nanoarchaeia archaeon]|nr:hypothetical protein [Candidatus Nanoarchaeia archaeon]
MPRKKSAQKKFQPCAKKPKGVSKAVTAVTGVALLAFLSYCGIDRHYDGEIKQRFLLRDKVLVGAKNTWRSDKPNFSLPMKMKYVTLLDSIEEHFDDNFQGFADFVKSEPLLFYALTDSDAEISGNVVKNSRGFEIKVIQNERNSLLGYITELLKGDYSHKDEIISIYDVHKNALFPNINNKAALEGMINAMAIYQQHLRAKSQEHFLSELPNYFYEDVITYQDSSGEKRISTEQLKEINRIGREYFSQLSEHLKNSSYTTLDEHFFDRTAISRFHTHPKNTDDCEPSLADKAGSYISGTSFVFARANDVLHIYVIIQGKSKEFYSQPLDSRVLHNRMK